MGSDERIEALLGAWSKDAFVEGRLDGGNRNRVWAVRVGGRRFAARLSTRLDSALDWEIDLLSYLRAAGMTVPEVFATGDGRSRVDGLMLFGWLEGRLPESEHDWRLVADELIRLHAYTSAWRQRPGFRSSSDLLEEDMGGDVRLNHMPPDVVQPMREVWRTLRNEPLSVVHGDPGPSNILLRAGKVGLIDWDEARVDASIFDLAALPIDLDATLGQARQRQARRAVIAWEVATGWVAEPAYARRRLAEFDALSEAQQLEPGDRQHPT